MMLTTSMVTIGKYIVTLSRRIAISPGSGAPLPPVTRASSRTTTPNITIATPMKIMIFPSDATSFTFHPQAVRRGESGSYYILRIAAANRFSSVFASDRSSAACSA